MVDVNNQCFHALTKYQVDSIVLVMDARKKLIWVIVGLQLLPSLFLLFLVVMGSEQGAKFAFVALPILVAPLSAFLVVRNLNYGLLGKVLSFVGCLVASYSLCYAVMVVLAVGGCCAGVMML